MTDSDPLDGATHAGRSRVANIFLSWQAKIIYSFVSLIVSIVLVIWLLELGKQTVSFPVRVQIASLFTTIFLIVIWGSAVSRTVSSFVQSSVRSLGNHKTEKDAEFTKFVEKIYSTSLANSIFDYEEFCKNEYFADWNRHAHSYVLIFLSSVASVGLAIYLLSTPDLRDSETWVTAAAAILPGIVSGICMKIWLETRKNMEASRRRIDHVFRTRVRMNLVLGRRDRADDWLDKEVALAEKLMGFIVPRGTGVFGSASSAEVAPEASAETAEVPT